MKYISQLNGQQSYTTVFKSIGPGVAVIVAMLLLSSCASSGNPEKSGSIISSGSRITACKVGDTLIQNSSQCIQDDAACYELNNGQWCTGERGSSCPAGSVAITEGMACPSGKRCFRISESLECTIS
ncbi:MAG: hypothetical protein ACI8VW_002790 [bacterium]|jgi:hypothetical protein